MNATITNVQTHQGRWGYYPCSYETYRKLKRLNFLAFMARIRMAAWQRWNRKQPQNRVIYHRPKTVDGCRVKREVIGPMPEPVTAPLHDFDLIYDDYRRARFPTVESQVKPLFMTEAIIDAYLKQMEEWYSK